MGRAIDLAAIDLIALEWAIPAYTADAPENPCRSITSGYHKPIQTVSHTLGQLYGVAKVRFCPGQTLQLWELVQHDGQGQLALQHQQSLALVGRESVENSYYHCDPLSLGLVVTLIWWIHGLSQTAWSYVPQDAITQHLDQSLENRRKSLVESRLPHSYSGMHPGLDEFLPCDSISLVMSEVPGKCRGLNT